MTKKQETAPQKEPSFEEALTELEGITQTLESGELPLEESLKLYERGVRLTNQCNARLKAAKLKIEELKNTADEE